MPSYPRKWLARLGQTQRSLLSGIAAGLSGPRASAAWGLLGKLKLLAIVLLCTLVFSMAPTQSRTLHSGTSGGGSPPTEPPATATPPRVWDVQRLPGAVMLGGGSFINAMGEEFVRLSGGRGARLVIIPTAYGGTEEEGLDSFVAEWGRWHPASVDVVHTRERAMADDPAFVAPLHRATGVWLCGGKQSRLLDTYKDTLLEQELHNVLKRGGAVGGNCAGAMALGELTIVRRTGGISLRAGLGIVPKLVVDSHWLERNRIERLRDVVEDHPGYFGLGIDSQTAAVLRDGQLYFVGNSYVSTIVPAARPQAVRFDVWEEGDEVDMSDLFDSRQ